MVTGKYPDHRALSPFFDVVMKGLKGLVDGEHYYDTIFEDAQFEFLYRFPGWPEVIRGRENLIAAYSSYSNNIVLEKGDGLAVHHAKEGGVVTLEYMARPLKRALRMTIDSCPSLPSRIERLFAGEITWTHLPRGRRSLANDSEPNCCRRQR